MFPNPNMIHNCPGCQMNNPFFNNFNNMNNMNNFNNNPLCMNPNFFMNNGFGPVLNMDVPRLHISGNSGWESIYHSSNQLENIQQNQNGEMKSYPGKINVLFSTTKGIIINMKIDYGKTVRDLIKLYFMRVNNEELFNRPNDICFIYNATKINFNDKTKVEKYFKTQFARITVNDTKGLIAA